MPKSNLQPFARPPSDSQLDQWNHELETLLPNQRLHWALDQFGTSIISTSSFGIHSIVTLHLISKFSPQIPIVFIDTGYLFAETYRYAHQLTELLQLNLHCYTPRVTPAQQEALYGKRWEAGLAELEDYLESNKIEPMQRAIKELQPRVWISGIRRSQSNTRQDRPILEVQGQVLKLYPIIDWTDEQVDAYLIKYNLPRHPLEADGYASVGDWHSTTKLGSGMRAQDTRFGGLKRECGLHDNSKWKGSK